MSESVRKECDECGGSGKHRLYGSMGEICNHCFGKGSWWVCAFPMSRMEGDICGNRLSAEEADRYCESCRARRNESAEFERDLKARQELFGEPL